jgi:hypothetical protein
MRWLQNAVEDDAELGAIPSDELITGVLVNVPRGWQAGAVEHGQFAMI